MTLLKSATTILFVIIFLLSCNSQVTEEKKVAEKKTDSTINKALKLTAERRGLPFSPDIFQESGAISLEKLNAVAEKLDSELLKVKADTTIPVKVRTTRINDIMRERSIISDRISKTLFESICMGNDDSQPVELYDGKLGVTKEFVTKFSGAVGQIQWKYDFGSKFKQPNNSAGNVAGVRWCTGAMISKDLFLTAGHCFDRTGSSWALPKINNEVIASSELAMLMRVNFNYQVNGQTKTMRSDTIDYPILELKEYRNGNLDYAIIRLGKDKNNLLPGEKFGFIDISNEAATEKAIAGIIQHPMGKPKVIEAGPINFIDNQTLGYNDIDTEGGSSGSPVISATKNKIIGVHVRGGCRPDNTGNNWATSIPAILRVSETLKKIVPQK